VYVVAAPEAVCAGLNDPHEPLGTQLQVTPLLAASWETVAATPVVEFVCIEAGGAELMATEIGGAVMVMLALALFFASLTEVAVIVTLPP
jgi:hypothetical protein